MPAALLGIVGKSFFVVLISSCDFYIVPASRLTVFGVNKPMNSEAVASH